MKVLVPLDGSKLAENSVHYVRLLAPLDGIEARLISVLDPYQGIEIGGTSAHWREVQQQRHLRLEEYLAEQASVLAGAGIVTTTVVREGSPAAEILEEAATADLLVISSHGRTGFERWRRGSVADKLVRAHAINTMVVGPHADEATGRNKIGNILVPLDGSDLAEQAFPLGARLARELGARLHLVESVPFPVSAEGSMTYMFDPEIYKGILDGAASYLDRMKATADLSDVNTAVLEGYPADLLTKYVCDKAIDLVVMTSHGRGGIVRTALGSVTDRLVGGHAPVLVVNAREVKK